MKAFDLLRVLGALGLTLFAAVALAQTTLYKYVGPDGRVVYSDKPPPKGTQYETLKPDTKPTGFNPRVGNGSAGNGSAADADSSIAAKRARAAAHEERVTLAQQNYDAAVVALEAAKEPQEGERTQNANGTSRLNENYFTRIGELQRKVDEAKAALDTANNE
jgi:hypothetical protein